MKRMLKNTKYEPQGDLTSEEVLAEVEKWDNPRLQGHKSFEYGNTIIERHSIQSMINDYIRWFNQSVDDCGDGYDQWDTDDVMHILYNDGHMETIGPDWHDGNKKIKTDGINSIILYGSWGDAVAGPCIKWENNTYYDDIIDIRPDFDI